MKSGTEVMRVRTRLDLSHANRGVDDLAEERASERAHGVLRRTVDAATDIWLAP